LVAKLADFKELNELAPHKSNGEVSEWLGNTRDLARKPAGPIRTIGPIFKTHGNGKSFRIDWHKELVVRK
jgi:hypothetical protein